MFRAFATLLFFLTAASQALAQQNYWVQIEARPTLSAAQERARIYASQFENVNGFYLGGGYYGITLGPYDQVTAEITLARLTSRGAVPQDSFVNDGRRFQQQFWPVGGTTAATNPSPRDPAVTAPMALSNRAAFVDTETPQQARSSERALSAEQRADLQRALRWAGFYDAAIDGAFGRGTRAAMGAWQRSRNLEDTGILTTRQRTALMDDYNSILDGLNLQLVRDDPSGIQMQLPTDVVAFAEYQPPFVRFAASGDIPQAQVLFISQEGDGEKLTGLYEVLQILDIMPTEGPRSLSGSGFTVEGVGDGIHSFATATLENGAIKGFMLVWPENDNPRRQRLITEMRRSFERLDGVLDPQIVPPSADQSVDMIAGLAVRKPQLSRSGFYASADGAVITTRQVVQNCERITLDNEHDATVVFNDADSGIAVLRPLADLAPIGFAAFDTGIPLLRDRIALAGYPFDGVLGAPTLTFGQIVDLRSLTGDNRLNRLDITAQPSDAGGPIFDTTGGVVGMLLPHDDGTNRVLPAGVNFSINAAQIVTLLNAQGITASKDQNMTQLTAAALTQQATDMAVLVSCW